MNKPHCNRRRSWLAGVLGVTAMLSAVPGSARADEMAWRQSSIRTEMQGMNYVRRGVAMLGNGEPATVTFRGAAAPVDAGRQPFTGRMTLRFEDGASFTFDLEGVTLFGAAGTPPTLSAAGKMVEGTGRFAGIRGTVEFSGHGVDAKADGALGDIFAKASASYTLQK
jgi:hypothetical protein